MSCSKDENNCSDLECITSSLCDDSNCINVEDSIYNLWVTQYNEVNKTHRAFSTNPNNMSEFIFSRIKVDSLGYSFQLVKYNRQTNLSTVLYENTLGPYGYHPPRWSGDGLIYFDINNKIYQIDSQGENLSLVNIEGEFNTLLDYSDKKIIYHDRSNSLIKIQNLETGELQTLENSDSYNYVEFSPDEKKIAFVKSYGDGRNYLAIRTISDSKVEELIDTKNPGITGLTWSNDGHYVYWSDMLGFYRFDVNDNNIERIIQHCGYTSNKKYVYPYFDNNGTLFLTKETAWKSGDNEISLKGEIIEYDLNTCTEIDIFE